MNSTPSLYTYFILAFCLAILTLPKIGRSQNSVGAFVMSSVGPIHNTSNSSMALTFSSNIACLNIQNGTILLIGERATGLFAMNCNVDAKFNTLGLKLYPNPVSLVSRIKFFIKPILNENFVINVITSDGVKLFTEKATGEQLFQGKQMNFSSLTIGTFILQVESATYIDAIKFIKAT